MIPAKAVTYLYEINASYGSFPTGPNNTITGSFTLDDSIGPASIANVNIQVTLPHGTAGPFSFSFNEVLEPEITWGTYLSFANTAYGAGDTHFWAYMSGGPIGGTVGVPILIGQEGLPFAHQSEVSVLGVNDWQGIYGTMTPEIAPVPEPSTWALLLVGFVGFGFMAYRRKSKAAFTTTALKSFVAVLTGILSSGPASADIVRVTKATGAVSGIFGAGVFGAAIGDRFSVVYTFDTSLGTPNLKNSSTLEDVIFNGGSPFWLDCDGDARWSYYDIVGKLFGSNIWLQQRHCE